MKKVVIAFDCDGTLITTSSAAEGRIVANERIRSMLITFASFKNVRIVVWSGAGEAWAQQVVHELGLRKYVNIVGSKNHIGKDAQGKHQFEPGFIPDIAIDDIQDCELGLFNLIVREK